jgi:thiamine-phosphate pyrophosphorylase
MKATIARRHLERVVDANFNRSKEGFRVLEDICRFVLNSSELTAGFKVLRHELTGAVAVFGLRQVISSREISRDVGRATSQAESDRQSLADVFYANAQRVKESLRVLEEFAKLADRGAAEKIKRIRYAVYGLEKKVLKRM